MTGRQTLLTSSAGILFFLIAFAALNFAQALDFTDMESPCGVDCAKSGLILCTLEQPECLCNSPSWFSKFSPCTFSQCPADVESILEDTISICDTVTITDTVDFAAFTSSASKFIATYTTPPPTPAGPTTVTVTVTGSGAECQTPAD